MFLRSLSRRAERNRSVVEVSKGRSEGFYVGNVCSIPFFMRRKILRLYIIQLLLIIICNV